MSGVQTPAAEPRETFEGWAILELMGHRRLAGKLSEVVVGGGSFIRIDIPAVKPVTQIYAPGSVYCITPCTEDVARSVAARTADPIAALGIDRQLPAGGDDDDDEEGIGEGHDWR